MTPDEALTNLYDIALEVHGQCFESGELYGILVKSLQEKQLLEQAAEQVMESMMDATNFRECHAAFEPLRKIIVMLRTPTV